MEKTFRIVGVVCAVVFVGWLVWYMLSEPDIHNQRERTNAVIESLNSVGAEQRNAESNIERIERGLDDSIGRADAIAERISDAENAITASQERRGECESIVADSERRIEESKRIIQGIRERARQNGK